MKNVAVLTEDGSEDGSFALFFCPHCGGFDSSRVPTPGYFPSKAKKMLMLRGQSALVWAQLESTDALQSINEITLLLSCQKIMCQVN